MSEMRDRMLAGEQYLPGDPELHAERDRCALLFEEYNATSVSDRARRRALLVQLLGEVGEDVHIRPPIYFDYGYQTTIGRGTFVNHGEVILDVGRVAIGEDVQIGPGVQLLTPLHPMDAAERTAGWESQQPIVIGNRVWLGGGVIVCPGVTIGEDTVIGAGAVVTRDVPARVFAAGNPCRVVRELT